MLERGFKVVNTEKHFHDHDETWTILTGVGTSSWIDLTGQRPDCAHRGGDVWMFPAGYEHGSEGLPGMGRNSDDFTIVVVYGTQLPCSHTPRYSVPPVDQAMMKGCMFVAQGKAALIDEPAPECVPSTLLCRTLYTGLTNGTEHNALVAVNYARG